MEGGGEEDREMVFIDEFEVGGGEGLGICRLNVVRAENAPDLDHGRNSRRLIMEEIRGG